MASFMIMDVLPIDVSFISPLAGSDLLLCAVFGGVISEVRGGMTIRFGGAIDGIDVLSVVFAKRIGISIGTFVMLFNTLLYIIICGIAIQSWILPLYSIVTYYVGSRTVDFITEGFDRAKCAMIVTVKANEISNALSENFDSDGTIVKAVGGYPKKDKEIIYFIVNRFQINMLKNIVHDIDESAFISLQEVADIIRILEKYIASVSIQRFLHKSLHPRESGRGWCRNGTIIKIFRLHTKTYKPRIVKNHGSGYFFAYF